MRIAALEDDDAQREAIARLLVGGGHNCQCFHLATPLIAALRRETFDLLVLDWNLPDMSGLDVVEWSHRNLAPCPPILLLTSRSAEADVVAGLNGGADDYVVKPVQSGVLLARVNALLRRSYPDRASGGVETHGEYRFNLPAEQVTRNGEPVPLTAKEFGLALLLFRNVHRALSRVRTKLELRPHNGYRLAPVYSYGYRLERLTEDVPEEAAE